jgi:hypothetical protein
MSRHIDPADMIIDPSTLDADTIARLVAKGRQERSRAIHAAFHSAFDGLFSHRGRTQEDRTHNAPRGAEAATC